MKRNTRLADILHVLLHMATYREPVTSESLASIMGTNPVVIRKTLGALRELRYVCSEKGHHGGWLLVCDMKKVTLYDIWQAIDAPSLFALNSRNAHPECLVENAVNHALDEARQAAEAVLLTRMKAVTLDQLFTDVHLQMSVGKAFKHSHTR